MNLLCVSGFESTLKVFKVPRFQNMDSELSFSLWSCNYTAVIPVIEIVSTLPSLTLNGLPVTILIDSVWKNGSVLLSHPGITTPQLPFLSFGTLCLASRLTTFLERLPEESLVLARGSLRCWTYECSPFGSAAEPRPTVYS